MKRKARLSSRQRTRKSPTTLLVGVGWYTAEEWAKVKAAAVDAERFEETYAEWVDMAEEALVELRARGVAAEKSYVKAADLLAWCLAHGKPNDGASRAEYVSEQARKQNAAGV